MNNQNACAPQLMEFVVCPVTKTGLIYDSKKQELISERAKLAYPIKDGMIDLRIDTARRL